MGRSPTSGPYQVHSSTNGAKPSLENDREPNFAAGFPTRMPNFAAGIPHSEVRIVTLLRVPPLVGAFNMSLGHISTLGLFLQVNIPESL